MSSERHDHGHQAPGAERRRIATLTLDPASIRRGNANIEHEREVAVYDILEANRFALVGRDDGPYAVALSVVDDKLVFGVVPQADGAEATEIALPLLPLRRLIRDYFTVCESYFEAIRSAPPSRIQQIDAGRRKLHDEGATALAERLADRVELDTTTARRLFTLLAALHWRG